MKLGRVLIACEESQAVTIEMRKLGLEAYSCDILTCSGGHPEWHFKQDVADLIKENWDMIIAFPPCQFLTVTGNKWYNIEKYGDKARQRHRDREKAIEFFMMIMNTKCEKIAIENPVGVMSTRYRKPDCIIQPYEFGDPVEKKTCLWLKGLGRLQPTNIVKPRERKKFKSGRTMSMWYADSWNIPKAERARYRSKTFPGIARAMAIQWGLNERENK
jgi:site-specific DNA-cytosine methylase